MKTSIKKEVTIYRLPIWRDITLVQKLAYFFYFMAETKPFKNIKPFTLKLSKSFRDRYKKLTYKGLKAVIIKKYMVILTMYYFRRLYLLTKNKKFDLYHFVKLFPYLSLYFYQPHSKRELG